MRKVPAAILGAALCCACGAGPISGQELRAQRLAKLDEITRKCGFPKSIFRLVGTEELHVKPSPDEKYERVDCALSELRKSGMPLKIGFIGNEAYSTGNGS